MHHLSTDLIGKTFGNLTVLSIHRSGKYLNALCNCKICGGQGLVRTWRVVNGSAKSCGCLCPKHKDIVGKRFGYWEVLSEEKTDKGYRAICKCHNCGKIVSVRQTSLATGRSRSCGCSLDQYKIMRGKNHPQFTGYEEITGQRWSAIKRIAEVRGYKMDLTIEQAWDVFLKQNKKCALTGFPLHFYPKRKTNVSLDRIDSTKGYFFDNVQWILRPLNIMKSTFSNTVFRSLCKMVSDSAVQSGVELLSQEDTIKNCKWNNRRTKIEEGVREHEPLPNCSGWQRNRAKTSAKIC